MLRWAIPGYRLPAEVVAGVVASYAALGIEFVTGVEVGADRSLDSLRAEYDAVFVAPGAWGRPGLALLGSELLQRGLDFLKAVRAGEEPSVGRRVVVVGGGNVAVDVAVVARRLGAERVTIVALEAACDLPAFAHEVDRACEEGIEVVDSCGVTQVLTDDQGRRVGLRLAACTCVFDDAGRFAPVLDESQLSTIEADQVVLAIGQTVELGMLIDEAGTAESPAGMRLALERGRLVAVPATGATAVPGVFAGGDAVSGPASVIGAIAAGRRAAEAIDAYLGILSGVTEPAGATLQRFAPDCLQPSPRAVPDEIAVAERRNFIEDAPVGLTSTEATTEAGRCFACGCVASTPSDLAPALVALDGVVVTTCRSIPAAEFFAAPANSSTVLAQGELVTEVRVPPAGEGTRFAYRKFRLRGAIDFPVLGLACVLDLDDGVIRKARVVFGAAAPWPVRVELAEAFLQGKALTAETILEAGRIAVADCLPLAANRYKVQIASGLVAKALSELAQGESVYPESA